MKYFKIELMDCPNGREWIGYSGARESDARLMRTNHRNAAVFNEEVIDSTFISKFREKYKYKIHEYEITDSDHPIDKYSFN